jgi:hypothetical protein
MANVNSNWERLWQVIEMSGMTINAFAQYIGMGRSETLYQIKRGNNGISRNVAESIVAKFPEISKVWLLTGYGSMYADSNNTAIQIPFFNCDMRRITETDNMTPASYMFLPQVSSVDLAICYYGEDMAPTIPNGTILLLARIDLLSIIYGNEYVIVGPNFVALRRVRRSSENDGLLRLEADDSERFDYMEIPRVQVEAVYAVRGKLIIKN